MICLTFDIEERFQSHLTPPDCKREWRLERCIAEIVDCLLEHGRQATFFVVGELAERYPGVVRRMADEGFDVASHSFTHPRFDLNPPEAGRRELVQSKQTLEDITGQRVTGFRAPSWSARLEDEWLWDFLEEQEFVYDSSLFPFKTHLYGSWDNPVRPFLVRPGLWEIPPTVYQFAGARLPYGGGFYFRLYPWWLTSSLLRRDVEHGRTPISYLHPWEFEAVARVPERGARDRFIANYNNRTTWSRLRSMLRAHETMSMAQLAEVLKA